MSLIETLGEQIWQYEKAGIDYVKETMGVNRMLGIALDGVSLVIGLAILTLWTDMWALLGLVFIFTALFGIVGRWFL